jgi:hypothetical protein
MLRSTSTQALLIAVLTALASFCALQASAGQPATPRRYSIVAQSSKATAATGRRPISQRIAASNLPLLIPAREGCNEHGCPAPTAAAPLVQPPVAEEATHEEGDPGEQSAANEPAPPAMLADTDDPDASPDEAEPASEASEAPNALLERVKTALAAKQQQAAAEEAAAAVAAEQPAGNAPARLEFNVRESRSLVKEGEQIVMRIAVRNVGGEPASEVNATLFFAEGMEPVQAIGHAAEVYPGEVRFGTLKKIPPGDSVDLLVTAIGTRPGSVTYRGELECSQLGGRIAREGAVTVRPRQPAAE